MNQKIYFLNMFPDYAPPDELCNVLAQAAIVAADIDPTKGHVSVLLSCPQYIPQRLLDQMGR